MIKKKLTEFSFLPLSKSKLCSTITLYTNNKQCSVFFFIFIENWRTIVTERIAPGRDLTTFMHQEVIIAPTL